MKPICAIIPVYGNQELTDRMLKDVLREEHLVEAVVIDNKGDYTGSAVKPDRNLGWLEGTNYGLAGNPGHQLYVCINNDVRLSHGFFQSLLLMLNTPDCGLFGPTYQGDFWHQRPSNKYLENAENYQSQNITRIVPNIDGTCLCIPATTLDNVGLLDARFAKFGWGADYDYAIRVRQSGKKVYVTEMAYLYHFGHATVKSEKSYSSKDASAELESQMLEKYGQNYKQLIWQS